MPRAQMAVMLNAHPIKTKLLALKCLKKIWVYKWFQKEKKLALRQNGKWEKIFIVLFINLCTVSDLRLSGATQ